MATDKNGGIPPPPDTKSMAQAVACVLISALDPALEGKSLLVWR